MEAAIYSDCLLLVNSFERSDKSADFPEFCHKWKACSFYHIYSAQTNNVQLIQTTRALLQVAKRLACDECKRSERADDREISRRRIAGVFLMYAVYFKQPTKEYVKIEVSPSTWRKIRQFVEDLPPNEASDDVRFTFWRLYEADAFVFAALDYCVGLDPLVDYNKVFNDCDEDQVTRNASALLKELSGYTDLRSMMPSLTVLEEGYNEMKEMLVSDPGSTTTLSARSLPATSIFKRVRNTLEQVDSLLKIPKATEDVTEESSRRQLKRKGFKGGDQDTEDRGGDEDNPQIAQPRQSVRTIFSEPLPLETLKELGAANADDISATTVDAIESDDSGDHSPEERPSAGTVQNLADLLQGGEETE